MTDRSKPSGNDSAPASTRAERHLRPLLRRGEQTPIAIILAMSLGAILLYVGVTHFKHGRLIHIERAEPWDLTFQVDVNTASWPELALLPDVGEELARRIVDFRNQHGPFHSDDQLMEVNGIGPKTIDGMRPFLLPLEDSDIISSE